MDAYFIKKKVYRIFFKSVLPSVLLALMRLLMLDPCNNNKRVYICYFFIIVQNDILDCQK